MKILFLAFTTLTCLWQNSYARGSTCKKLHSKACLAAFSRIDQKRIKSHILTKEQNRLHGEILLQKGVHPKESTTMLKTFQKWSCSLATNNFQSRAYCYDHCVDSDECHIENKKK